MIYCVLQVNQLQEALNSYLSHRTYSCFIDGRQFEYGTFLQIDNSKICFCNVSLVFPYNAALITYF